MKEIVPQKQLKNNQNVINLLVETIFASFYKKAQGKI